MISPGSRPRLAGDKLHKLAGILGREGRDDLYRGLLTFWDMPDQLVLNATEPRGVLWDYTVRDEGPAFTEHMQVLDTMPSLPNDLLVKCARRSMAHELGQAAWREM